MLQERFSVSDLPAIILFANEVVTKFIVVAKHKSVLR